MKVQKIYSIEISLTQEEYFELLEILKLCEMQNKVANQNIGFLSEKQSQILKNVIKKLDD